MRFLVSCYERCNDRERWLKSHEQVIIKGNDRRHAVQRLWNVKFGREIARKFGHKTGTNDYHCHDDGINFHDNSGHSLCFVVEPLS